MTSKSHGLPANSLNRFTYSSAFSALIATSAAEFHFWTGPDGNRGIDGGIIYLCFPIMLIFLNTFAIEIYGFTEVISGTLKLLFLGVIMAFLIAINVGAGNEGYLGFKYWNSPVLLDSNSANNWGTGFLICLSIATFAYVGVEIVAASALEAQWPNNTHADARTPSDISQRSVDTLIGNTVKFSAKHISSLATIVYSISGFLVSLDIPWNDCYLPRLSWTKETAGSDCSSPLGKKTADTTSAFVAIGLESGIHHIGHVFNAFLVFTCLSCASTQLYVASRTLFGLTSRLDGGEGQPWFLHALAWIGRTNHRRVPVRAMVISAAAFCWVPFLQLRGGTNSTTPIGMFVEILAQMSSVGVIIVWACEALAFIRYYHCIRRHRTVLEHQKVPQVRRWCDESYDDYPYRSHGQPVLAYVAFIGCLFILFVANGASVWKKFHWFPFLASYITVMAFLVLWVALKLFRGSNWSFVDLSNPERVVRKIRDLHDVRLGASSL
ncbi:uncharacterized protein BJX67DRAFT_352567 [Aspergillus lucknowensis]|uniref:Amino acid permease/ SLC12A domain-containing protein n=1 Tax=Aspergillus lucknowensis TaxID=176173 RepID=A0ABR4LSP3_9EURO